DARSSRGPGAPSRHRSPQHLGPRTAAAPVPGAVGALPAAPAGAGLHPAARVVPRFPRRIDGTEGSLLDSKVLNGSHRTGSKQGEVCRVGAEPFVLRSGGGGATPPSAF